MDRIEFEELALKSIDLSMAPSLAQFVSENKKAPLTVRRYAIISYRSCMC